MKDIQFQPPPDHITYPAFKTGGLERGEMTIITALSREGKSAFEVGIMINIKEAKAYDV